MENNYDFFKVQRINTSTSSNLSGTLPANSWITIPNTVNNDDFNQIAGILTVQTDSSVPSIGYNITKARVSCAPASSPVVSYPYLATRNLNTGVLLGTNDSIFFRFGADVGITHNLVLTGTNTTDFDLYARCNAEPTKTAYTFRSYSGDSNEFLSLPYESCPNGTWFVVVNSYSGAGGFSLLRSSSFQSQNLIMRAYVQSNTNTAVDSAATLLALAARRFYTTTMGAMRSLDIRVCGGNNYNCGGPFTITRRFDCSRSFGYIRPSNGALEEFALCNDANADVAVHEMGHAYLGLKDEYQDVGNPPNSLAQCGHTRMAASWIPSLCDANNHSKDFQPGTTASPVTPSGWWTHSNQFMPSSMIPLDTPSIVDLSNHDFNDAIVVTKNYGPY
jgi:hypothetical protein